MTEGQAALPSWELPEPLWNLLEPLLPVRNWWMGRLTQVDLQQVAAED